MDKRDKEAIMEQEKKEEHSITEYVPPEEVLPQISVPSIDCPPYMRLAVIETTSDSNFINEGHKSECNGFASE